jgi:hypothetical protein
VEGVKVRKRAVAERGTGTEVYAYEMERLVGAAAARKGRRRDGLVWDEGSGR